MGIESFIPFGEENAISRERLAAVTGESDRRTRQKIEDARREGSIIINAQKGAGYFRLDPDALTESDLAAVSRQYWQNKSRALSVLSYQKHLRRILKAHNMKV